MADEVTRYGNKSIWPSPGERWWLGTAVFLSLIARIIFVLLGDPFFDDAYITLRYARNLANGIGFVYNAGEQVYGASSPLYTMLCASFALVFNGQLLAEVVRWVGVVGSIVFALCLWSVLPVGAASKMLTMAALLSYPRIFFSSVGGMEECVILAIMGLSAWAAVNWRWYWAGFFCGILLVFKVDTIIWCAGLLFSIGLSKKKIPWGSIGVFLLVLIPWGIFSLSYFGSIIPHTIEAKRIAYAAASKVSLGDMIGLAAPRAFMAHPWLAAFVGAFVYGSTSLSLYRVVTTRNWILLVFPLYCIGYVLGLFISGTGAFLWVRWTVPLWAASIACFGICLGMLPFDKRWPHMGSVAATWKVGLLCVLSVCVALPFAFYSGKAPDESSFENVGSWLHTHARPTDDVLLEPIGKIGYLSGIRVDDFVGLVSPEVTIARAAAGLSNRWFSTFVSTHHPVFIVLRDLEIRNNEFLYAGYGDQIFLGGERDWFNAHYREVHRTTWGPEVDRLIVFSRIAESNP